MNIRGFFTKKKIIWTIIILLAGGFIAFNVVKGKDPSKNITTETARKQNLKRTVLATGQVVSQTDLALSFKVSGVAAKVNVKEGSQVKQGEILAALEQKDQAASLTSARGSLAQAQANYQKVLAGASSEEIVVAQTTLDNAKKSLETAKQQQDVLVANAYKALLNSTLAAVSNTGNTNSTNPTISGTYNGTDQGVYHIIQEGGTFYISGLEELGNQNINTNSPVPLGTKGLFILFPAGYTLAHDKWTVTIPNTQATNYVTNYNAYQAAVQARQVAIDSAQAQVNSAQAALDLKKAQARPADIAAAEAQILSAQGQVQAAEAAWENTVLRAPADGTITSVGIKAGELATALKEVMVLQDVGNLHVEANISEANVADLKIGQGVDLTFDALGVDRHFSGKVQTVNPASTMVSGVVNYKVTASLDKIEEIKPGMTANMIVLVSEKPGVLSIPQRAVIARDGKKFVRVVTDAKKKSYREEEVATGMEADGGLVEITSGLREGQEIVTLIKK